MMDELRLTTSADRDICDPLDSGAVCQGLNDSGSLCRPSKWAGEAIEDALNATRAAMGALDTALHFRVSSSSSFHPSSSPSAGLNFRIQRQVGDEFNAVASHCHVIADVIAKSVPVALLLLVYSASEHLKAFLSNVDYDNVYVNGALRRLDGGGGLRRLLPLKRFERRRLVDTSTMTLAPPEVNLWTQGMTVFILHFLFSVNAIAFDLVLHWVLCLVRRQSLPGFDDVTGSDSLDLVVTGRGVIVNLFQVFLRGFHPGRWFTFTGSNHECVPVPSPPSLLNIAVLSGVYAGLLLTIVFKAYLLRARNQITAFLYPERELERLTRLINVIVDQRSRSPGILREMVRMNHRGRGRGAGKAGSMAFARCRVGRRCLVCGLRVRSTKEGNCVDPDCTGFFCSECYVDLGAVCPLCSGAESDKLHVVDRLQSLRVECY